MDTALILGGWQGNKNDHPNYGPCNKNLVYNDSTNSWLHVSKDMPGNLSYHSSAYIEPYVYVIGGYDGDKTNSHGITTCYKFNVFTLEWSPIASLDIARLYSTCVAHKENNSIILVGGSTRRKSVERTMCHDPYQILNVPSDATRQQIIKAGEDLKREHSELDDNNILNWMKICMAVQFLSDDDQRQKYDEVRSKMVDKPHVTSYQGNLCIPESELAAYIDLYKILNVPSDATRPEILRAGENLLKKPFILLHTYFVDKSDENLIYLAIKVLSNRLRRKNYDEKRVQKANNPPHLNLQGKLRLVEQYSIAEDKWTSLPYMKECRSDAACAIANNKLIVAGGFNGTKCLESVELYDFDLMQWFSLPDMSCRRSGLALVAYDQGIVAIGGYEGSHTVVNSETGETERKKGKRLASCEILPIDEKYMKDKNDHEHQIKEQEKGYETSQNRQNEISACGNFKDTWATLPAELNQGRSNFGSCVIEGNQILILGGYNEGTLNTCERFRGPLYDISGGVKAAEQKFSQTSKWEVMPDLSVPLSAMAVVSIPSAKFGTECNYHAEEPKKVDIDGKNEGKSRKRKPEVIAPAPRKRQTRSQK